ncbi:MAG: ABC transporter ATP-binding protein [Deltaproteobacteria bacterium]|nr:ABC transporter ATP-binding protein [Deltaproteobacteria bacterium]
MDAPPPVVELRDVARVYQMGDTAVHALRGVTLQVTAGELVAVMGTSGSGKSTLMNLVGCLDRPSSGSCLVDGQDVGKLSRGARAQLRGRTVGFVFQNFHLLPRTSALENVELPLVYQGVARRERVRRSAEALTRVGLGDRLHHRSNEMSGGQMQRVAIARALVTRPRLLLADEPTGNLDSRTSTEIMALLQEVHAGGITVVLVTHSPEIAAHAQRVLRMHDGCVVEDRRQQMAPAGVAA